QCAIHADADRGLELAARNGEIAGAEHLRLIGAGDDADGERAGGEGRHPDEALVTEEQRRFGQKRRSAEINEIDDEQLRQTAEQGRVGLTRAARKQLAREPRPGDEAADRRADKEATGGDEESHRRAVEERQAPAALAEAEDRQIAHHFGAPRERALSTQGRAQGLYRGVRSILNHCSEYFLTEPSAIAAASALLNLAVRSASLLRMPMPSPSPNTPPINFGPTTASSEASGLEAVAMLVGRSSSTASSRPDLRSRSRSSVVLY